MWNIRHSCRLMVFFHARTRESGEIHAFKSRLRGNMCELPSRWVDITVLAKAKADLARILYRYCLIVLKLTASHPSELCFVLLGSRYCSVLKTLHHPALSSSTAKRTSRDVLRRDCLSLYRLQYRFLCVLPKKSCHDGAC